VLSLSGMDVTQVRRIGSDGNICTIFSCT